MSAFAPCGAILCVPAEPCEACLEKERNRPENHPAFWPSYQAFLLASMTNPRHVDTWGNMVLLAHERATFAVTLLRGEREKKGRG